MGGDTPFSKALLTAGEPAIVAVVVVVVALCLGIAVVVQEVLVANIVQLATSVQEIAALGDEVFSPSPHKFLNIQERVEEGGFRVDSHLSVASLGCPLPPRPQ